MKKTKSIRPILTSREAKEHFNKIKTFVNETKMKQSNQIYGK